MKTIICDIDNTIANIEYRLKYIINEDGSQKEVKDWDKFFDNEEMIKDNIRWEVVRVLNHITTYTNLQEGKIKLFFVTGRPEKTRRVTSEWIKKNMMRGISEYSTLLMRPDGNYIDDHILKKELTKDLENVEYIFEDRKRVIDMYRCQFPDSIIIDCGKLKHFSEEREHCKK